MRPGIMVRFEILHCGTRRILIEGQRLHGAAHRAMMPYFPKRMRPGDVAVKTLLPRWEKLVAISAAD